MLLRMSFHSFTVKPSLSLFSFLPALVSSFFSLPSFLLFFSFSFFHFSTFGFSFLDFLSFLSFFPLRPASLSSLLPLAARPLLPPRRPADRDLLDRDLDLD